MSDLESILIKFNGSPFLVFGRDGSLTDKGKAVYSNLCSLLYDLKTIVPKVNAEEIEKELDKIVVFES